MKIPIFIRTILMSPQKINGQRQYNEIIQHLQPDLYFEKESTTKLTEDIKDLKKELQTLKRLKSEMAEMKSWDLTSFNCLKSLPNIKITYQCVKSVLRASWDCT